MKKIIALLMAVVFAFGVAQARDKVCYDDSCLPQMARQTLKKNFKSAVNHIKVDKELFNGTEYDVVLRDGTEIEFDNDGNWTSVETIGGVPSSFLLPSIKQFVKKNYKNQKVVKVSVDRKEYEVELQNGIELKFDRAGNFLRVDD